MSSSAESLEKRKILLTGAAGRIGATFRQYARERYRFRLADRNLELLGDPAEHEIMQLDIADLAACQRACEGIDTVLHLAGDPSPRADFYGSLLDNNIKGVYNIFRAAKDQGCRRVIFASSVQVISGYPLDVQARPDSPVKPINMYGVAKCFGEATAHYFALAEGLSSIAVRIGSFEGNRHDWTEINARNLSTFVSKRDLCHLFVRCIETPGVQFAIVHGVSNNRFKRMDISSTKEILGYAPQDDSFQLFKTGLRYQERWFSELPEPPSDNFITKEVEK
jgi:nucleoside-diphosphate-sugar epimerase